MKKGLSFILLAGCILWSDASIGQPKISKKNNHPPGKQHSVSLGAILPLGNFSSTHVIGVATIYSWSDHRFGRMDVKPVKPFGFTANTGFAFYFGKKEKISGYPYDYPGYVFVHAYGGVIYNPWKKTNISLTGGPALGIYNGNTEFNIGVNLAGNYYLKDKIALSPGIIFMKESGADPLWAVSLKATMAF